MNPNRPRAVRAHESPGSTAYSCRIGGSKSTGLVRRAGQRKKRSTPHLESGPQFIGKTGIIIGCAESFYGCRAAWVMVPNSGALLVACSSCEFTIRSRSKAGPASWIPPNQRISDRCSKPSTGLAHHVLIETAWRRATRPTLDGNTRASPSSSPPSLSSPLEGGCSDTAAFVGRMALPQTLGRFPTQWTMRPRASFSRRACPPVLETHVPSATQSGTAISAR